MSTRTASNHSYDMRDHLLPQRITNAMWDFSWLNGHYPGGPFADWDRALDDLLERRFNTARIDAFPHIVGGTGSPRQMLKASPMLNWGHSTVDQEHDYAAELIEFVGKCRQRGIGVILSTWSAKEIAIPDGAQGDERFHPLWQAWERTLDLLAKHDLLGSILYVDFDQEFPYFSNLQPLLAKLAGGDVSVPVNAADAMEAAGRRETGPRQLAWNPGANETRFGLLRRHLSAFPAALSRVAIHFFPDQLLEGSAGDGASGL